MLNLGLSEIGVIALVALVFTRPEDFPRVMRTMARFVRRARYLHYLFSQQFETFIQMQDPATLHNRHAARSARIEEEEDKTFAPETLLALKDIKDDQ